MVRNLSKLFLAAAAVLALGACNSNKTEGPGDVAVAFSKAALAGDVETAMSHMSSEINMLGRGKVQGMMQMSMDQARQRGDIIPDASIRVVEENVDGDTATVVMEMKGPDGEVVTETMHLVREGDAWKVSMSANK